MSQLFKLSAEEVAFVMATLGQAELAAAYLKSIIGDVHPDNLTGRLTAASHSLMARDLFMLDLDAGDAHLDTALESAFRVMLDADHLIRCTRSASPPPAEEQLMLFIQGDQVVANRIQLEVLSHVETMTRAGLADQLFDFIGAEKTRKGGEESLGMISTDTLQVVRREAETRPAEPVVARLTADLPVAVAEEIVADFANPAAKWGSIVRLVSQETADQQGDSTAGLLYTVLPDHLWLFHIAPDNQAVAHIYRGHRDRLRSLVEQMLP